MPEVAIAEHYDTRTSKNEVRSTRQIIGDAPVAQATGEHRPAKRKLGTGVALSTRAACGGRRAG
jgi:hypothetical protein